MKSRTKVKAAAVPVPQSRDDAVAAVARIGEIDREEKRIQTYFDDEIARLKASAEAEVSPLKARREALTEGLRIWSEANRAALTDGGRVKFADLGTGRILWRRRPPKVSIRGAETIIETLKSMALGRFVRVKEEVDREAMLREPEVASSVSGVTVGSEGEDFVVEPLSVPLVGGAADVVARTGAA